jgi:monoterpene epsilon-lactone hydrolase
MPSWQSYLIHPFLRLYVKRRLARAASAGAARALLGTPMPALPGASFTPDHLGGVPGEWVNGQAPPEATLLYIHGGGYFTRSPQTHRSITSAFALRGFAVYAPDYRLAPEHPFPAAIDDALAAYRALIAQTRPERLAVAGDSAGGGLALAMLLAAKAENLPLPACIILFSPWTDLACTGASLLTNAERESMLYAPRITEAAAVYLDGADPQNPLASPLYGDLTGLPPMLIHVSECEILLDDSTRLAGRIRAAGGRVDLTIWPNLPHVWQVSQILLPEARESLDQAASFAKSTLASEALSA